VSATTEQLLESVHRLPDDQLQEFTEQVLRLNALRRSPSLSTAESRLLKAINQPISAELLARYRELTDNRDAGTLIADEHRELCELSDWLEERNAERLGYVAEFAALRGLSLSQLMDQLDLGYLAE
jgi:hypothetical protein